MVAEVTEGGTLEAAVDTEVAHFMGVAANLGEVGPRFIKVAVDLGEVEPRFIEVAVDLEVMEELLKASEEPERSEVPV